MTGSHIILREFNLLSIMKSVHALDLKVDPKFSHVGLINCFFFSLSIFREWFESVNIDWTVRRFNPNVYAKVTLRT